MPHKILVVDDEEGMLTILKIILGRAGFQVLAADCGEDALELIYSERPSVVVLDDMMPGLTGGDVCLRVKADAEVRDIPIVMHSAGMRIQDANFIRSIGADATLAKPCPPGKMVDTVRGFLAQGV